GSTSAGDMFMGAFVPGLVLVGLYMLFILVLAMVRKRSAPPVPYEGKYDFAFVRTVVLALVPPLMLIFIVLGSIILGVATVNQAGAIGAVGAMIMAGYRVRTGSKGAYVPAVLALASTVILAVMLNRFDINVKSIDRPEDLTIVLIAALMSVILLVGILWSAWRTLVTNNILHGVMVETAKTTSLVFIILLGAAMLTAAFRSFGGEVLVKDFLTSLPGGFITKFVVVMAVIFLLGFFLDFIEIAVVVVPIVAPILLADTTANVTAVWLGVMIGINMQTSFLTPPFGFALFYLRGVAPPSVKTLEIYKGVVPFIALQLVGLGIAGVYPSLVNYLPNRTSLLADTAPPPMNPTLQYCVEETVFAEYDALGPDLRRSITRMRALDISYVSQPHRDDLAQSFEAAAATFDLVAEVRATEAELAAYIVEYRPLHREVRQIEAKIARIGEALDDVQDERRRLSRSAPPGDPGFARLDRSIGPLENEIATLEGSIPEAWEDARARYLTLSSAENQARIAYRRNVDGAYNTISIILGYIDDADELLAFRRELLDLSRVLIARSPDQAADAIMSTEKALRDISGADEIIAILRKARRAISHDSPDRLQARVEIDQALVVFGGEVAWRRRAAAELVRELASYEATIRDTIGLRRQDRLPDDIAKRVAACRSIHRDISLNF
ncbi:MAG: TRAP transporter large permease subunit, partial [Alphaproteobacteria bacterium]|nr:TRAP transporter large permease subunit [Alphaproteobacteria bacterium]